MPPVTTAETQEAAAAAILKERRFKLSRACDRCRRRRIKCDEGHPCQACLAASSACTFEEPGKRTHPHKSKRTATLEDRMHHLETLIQAIPPAVFAAGHAGDDHPMSMGDAPASPIAPFMFPSFASGVPPPSLHVFPLTNPSTHFTPKPLKIDESIATPLLSGDASSPDQLAEETSRLSLSASYLYFDDEGYTRWQGETSGLPLLDLLVERHVPSSDAATPPSVAPVEQDWFPNRTPRRTDVNPQTLWRLITSYVAPELMDSLVHCYLSTSYYLLPFLHVPTFLADYGNPQKWGEPGFGAFIVAICCLASRHMDDPRVRASPQDGISAGTQWFELLGRLRTLPIADRPTLYTIQADLIAAVYAVGLGKLSKAAALLSEAVTISIDAGLHRNADTYDLFDPIEDEVRKRTFWCVYIWDKQLSAHFGRPPMLRLRDCDVGEPAQVDDEYITREGVGAPVLPPDTSCRMTAFVCALRMAVVLESVLDIPPVRDASAGSFLMHAGALLGGAGSRRVRELREEEGLLDEIHHGIPTYFAHNAETLASEDTIRFTQAVRLHCAEQFVKLLIYRHRFSELVAERTAPTDPQMRPPQSEVETDAMVKAHYSALQIIASHLLVAKKGLMTYYGVHVIHQLTQAGRTLVAVLLNCKTETLQPLIPPGLDALRSCVGLLRRFSGRYVCGLRSGDLMEEFCRLTQIPLDAPRESPETNTNSRPPWIRPVRKKSVAARARSSSAENSPSHNSGGSSHSPEAFSPSDFFVSDPQPGEYGATSFSEIDGLVNGGGGDARMYAEVLAMFNDGSTDGGGHAMFSPTDFTSSVPSPGFSAGIATL
ncbi:fungal-specific transcription factor domain-containing protein [Roridomyces roridus]|uniref:Fungal-specific transcription factor domain-containing protein n=1 Tax=Roridomyces roridus TaxID=1738132 RepID=A0AAD7B1G2_9AGAR|nr:fungal-specific transcription factor domain-containing protein [Roridomyces roridus]KAJ7621472.1 fungal-specific transcription factor domain-containing protein [Roridomyces roridus]